MFIDNKHKFWLLIIEFVVIALILIAFWHPSPGIRDMYIGLLWLSIPFIVWRVIFHRDLLNPAGLGLQFLLFALITAINFRYAPYARENYWVLVCRPLAGIWLFYHLTTWATVRNGLRNGLVLTLGLSATLIFFAMTGTQWIPEDKGEWIAIIADILPTIDYGETFLRRAYLSFNPNEISGAMTFICPMLAAWAVSLQATKSDSVLRTLQWLSGILAITLFLLIFLAQSRSALLGCLVAFGMIGLSHTENKQLRRIMLGLVTGCAVLVLALFLNVGSLFTDDNTSVGISSRDLVSSTSRFEIWGTAVDIMRDYPLTGNGMSMFRTITWVDPAYDIYHFRRKSFPAPHAHNEWLQIGTDFGVIGVLIYAGWFISIGWLLWRGWQTGTALHKTISIGVFAGLVSHGTYGLFDAITLWDRFFFIQWWLFGLAGLVAAQSQMTSSDKNSKKSAKKS